MQQRSIGSASVLCATTFPGQTPQHLTFAGVTSECKWALQDLDREFPSDWSSYTYLVLELKNSSPQRFFVRVHTPDGVRVLRIQPVGHGVWYRAAIPLQYFKGKDQSGHDLASTINRPRNSFWMSVEGPFGSLDNVEALELAMEYPIGQGPEHLAPTIEIRLLGLAQEDPGAEILEQLPVVDEFGQWRPVDWPGKITSLEQLRAEWAGEEQRLASGAIRYTHYGGYPNTQARATGFFRVEEIDGRWWFVDPEGRLFLSTGVNGTGAYSYTRTAGRESYYTVIPPDETGRGASFYTLNLRRRFGEQWQGAWAAQTLRRMEAWGLNTIYAWERALLAAEPRKPYVVTVRGWQTGTAFLGMPDVYADEFARQADEVAARECAPYRDDSYLLGYFVGNEPPWPDRESELVDMILAGPPTAIQGQAKSFLAHGDTPGRRREFVLSAFERYLEIINGAVRRQDPNHLNLGLRFGLEPPEDIIRMGRHFDVYSLNIYGVDPTAKVAGGSFFREKRTLVIDPASLEYLQWRDPRQPSLTEANKIGDPVERVRKFISLDDDAARFGWDLLAATFVYSANRVPEICDDIAQIDRGMRWGYAWDLGPFELWDALGVKETVARMQAEGRNMPEWVLALAASDDPHFYRREGAALAAWGPGKTFTALPARPRALLLADLKQAGKTLDESPAASLVDLGDHVACLEFRTKANLVTEEVHQFIEKILGGAGDAYDALVIGNQGSHFSGGADIKMMADRIRAGEFDAIEATLRYVQKVSMALKYSPIPVVAAPFGRVLGGGLEICLHCDRIQADADVNMGLVEAGVGLVPSAGGIKESLIRAMDVLRGVAWPFPNLMTTFEALAQAKITGSAWEAFDWNYMRRGDGVTMNRESVIYAAKRTALGMLEAGYQPPLPAKVKVMGVDGIGNFRSILYNMGQSQFISEHDRYLGEKIAWVLSGGDVDPNTEVDEWYLLALERRAFLEVCRTPKTLERIQAVLTTGKPLRN